MRRIPAMVWHGGGQITPGGGTPWCGPGHHAVQDGTRWRLVPASLTRRKTWRYDAASAASIVACEQHQPEATP